MFWKECREFKVYQQELRAVKGYLERNDRVKELFNDGKRINFASNRFQNFKMVYEQREKEWMSGIFQVIFLTPMRIVISCLNLCVTACPHILLISHFKLQK